MSQRDLLTRLADRGEEMLKQFAETPGASRVLELLNATRERLDDTQKRLVGLEALERRLDALEQRLDRIDPEGAEQAAEELVLPGTATPPASAEDIVIPAGTSIPPVEDESPSAPDADADTDTA